jgi:hypothetical protein
VALLAKHEVARSIVPAWEEQAGWVPRPIGAFVDGKLQGGLLLTERRAPGPLPVAVARVPLVLLDPAHAGAMLTSLLEHIEREARARGLLELEFRLHVPANEPVPGFEYQIEFWKAFEQFGYRMLKAQDHTFFVDIQRTDDELIGARPSFAEAQIEWLDDERLRLTFRSPTRAGQSSVVVGRLQLLRRQLWLTGGALAHPSIRRRWRRQPAPVGDRFHASLWQNSVVWIG